VSRASKDRPALGQLADVTLAANTELDRTVAALAAAGESAPPAVLLETVEHALDVFDRRGAAAFFRDEAQQNNFLRYHGQRALAHLLVLTNLCLEKLAYRIRTMDDDHLSVTMLRDTLEVLGRMTGNIKVPKVEPDESDAKPDHEKTDDELDAEAAELETELGALPAPEEEGKK
jgi:hypothetical protein